jgi:hypothetical protein
MELGPLENQDDLLDFPFFVVDYEPRTIRQELEAINEDIIDAQWEVEEFSGGERVLNKLIVWTDKSVIFPYSFLGDKFLTKVQRNPN